MEQKDRNNISSWTFGLVFPIIGAIKALRNPKSKTFVLLFTLFYGFMGVGLCFSLGDNSDVSRYAESFIKACMNDVSFLEYFKTLHKSNQIDYYLPFVTWLCSKFTNNYHVFLGLLAIVNGFFLASNVYYISQKTVMNKETKWLLILLAFIPNTMYITHRWWTALNVFLFGALRFIIDRRKAGLLVSAAAFFIHFSFLYPFLFLCVSSILPSKSNLVLLIIFCVFSVIDTFDLHGLSNTLSLFMPKAVVSRTDMYIEYEIAERNFLSRSTQIIFKAINLVLSIAVYVSIKDDNKNPYSKLFTACLLLGIFTSITGTVEYGWRYYDISNFLFIALYVLTISYYYSNKSKLGIINYFTPFFIYIIIYQIRGLLDGIGPNSLFFGNYLTIWIIDDKRSVLQLIKDIIWY